MGKTEDVEDVVHSEFDHPVLDERLRPFVGADDVCYEALLSDLIPNKAMPLIETVIGSKLNVYSGQVTGQREDQEFDDLCHEAATNLIAYLNDLRQGQTETTIRVLEDFVAKIAFNVFNNFLRRKYPRRHSLKKRIEYLLRTREEFDSWKDGHQKLAGYARWKGRPRSQNQNEVLADLRHDARAFVAERADGQSVDQLPLQWLLTNLFDWVGEPIELDLLVDVTARVQRIVDVPGDEEPAEFENLGQSDNTLTQLEQRQYLKKVWSEILLLPSKQRKALLLNLKDGVGVIDNLPLCQIASPVEIARALEMTLDELALLWDRLPLSDAEIAKVLETDPQKIANLRKTARERLERKMRKLLKQ